MENTHTLAVDNENYPYLIVGNFVYPLSMDESLSKIRQIYGLEGTSWRSKAMILREELIEKALEVSDVVTVIERSGSYLSEDGHETVLIGPVKGDGKADLVYQLTDGEVVLRDLPEGCYFKAMPNRLPLERASETPDFRALFELINIQEELELLLLVAWMTYTLCHPKVSPNKFVLLALTGGQGTGKTVLSTLLRDLIDPNRLGVQSFPASERNLTVALQQSHVVFFDNLSFIKKVRSDFLCQALTGATLQSRTLFTDAGSFAMKMHSPMVLNGISNPITEPDLAERSLVLKLEKIDPEERVSDKELQKQFRSNKADIFAALLDISAEILNLLPSIKPTKPARMIDFSHWLAGMEKVFGFEDCELQEAFISRQQNESLGAVLETTLGAAVKDFLDRELSWKGTPQKLLDALRELRKSYRGLPDQPIGLTKALKKMQPALENAGIEMEFGRSKERWIKLELVDQWALDSSGDEEY